MVALDHPFSSDKPLQETWQAILDLQRLVPCVQGGKVTEAIDDESVKAEINVKMGAMSMKFAGTVKVAQADEGSHKAMMEVRSRAVGSQGYANADVTFTLDPNGGGNVHTEAKISGKAASMGEGVIESVLDAMIKDFTGKLAQL